MATVEVKKIIEYCEKYLDTKSWQDYCHNGLQVEGALKVGKIISGVSLSEKLIDVAVKKRAKMILVHHGIFKNTIGSPPQIIGVAKNRLRKLLSDNINLAGFHLPLDAHPTIGNNISLLKIFGLKKLTVINSPLYGDIGFIGEAKTALKFTDFVEQVNNILETNSYVIAAGPKNVKTIGIISGGASPDFEQAADLGADTYICGDAREEIVRAVEEKKINFINAGHYNTEKLGVQNLGDLIAKKFNIKHEFVDIPNDI